jgi:hypothetical protein
LEPVYDLGHGPRLQSALDADGALYQVAVPLTNVGDSYVLKRPLAPDTSVILFDDTGTPTVLSPYSRLFTGP